MIADSYGLEELREVRLQLAYVLNGNDNFTDGYPLQRVIDVLKIHENDPNFPLEIIQKFKAFLGKYLPSFKILLVSACTCTTYARALADTHYRCYDPHLEAQRG